MSDVLFDQPGPKARARHNVMTAAAGAVLVGLAAVMLWKLWQEGEFEAELWEDLAQPNIAQAILDGIVATVSAAASGIVLSVIFGGLFAVGRLSEHAWVRWPARVVVEFFRAVPLLLLIIFIFYGFQDYLGTYWSLVIALMLYNGSVLSEVFRAGMLAVPTGQSEAAYAVGMRKNQVMRLVLLPQAVTIMLPAIISQCVIVLKDTALGVIISYPELVFQGQLIAEYVKHAIVPLALIAVIFIVMNYSLSKLAVFVERRFAQRGHSSAKKTAQVEAGALDQSGGA
ncbi:MAG TPA: amino acid ABC transporter permease [Nocardioidaceae bacterium]|nr:amino acid ABC transporter permease [Nocardioidaceae bacterium]